jgi:hypothetical protein
MSGDLIRLSPGAHNYDQTAENLIRHKKYAIIYARAA